MEQIPVALEKSQTRETDFPRRESDAASDTNKSLETSGTQTPIGKPLASRARPYERAGRLGPITEALAHHLWIKRRRVEDLDDIATQRSVYDGDHAEFYYPRENWENYHNFDPSFRWTWREEQKALRKVDIRIFGWILVMFFALNTFLKDLGLKQDDYNVGMTIFRFGFLIAELPSQLISKRLGPDIWIPIQIVIFGTISASQFWLSGKASFFATRALIAIFQGGLIPDFVLMLSYYYTKADLSVRLAIFFTCNYWAGIITNFTAAGFIEMSGVLGYSGWRWMFLGQGLIALIIGIVSFFIVPPGVSQTQTILCPKGYLDKKDEKIIVNRVIRDDHNKGEMHNREGLSLKMLWASITDYHLWPMYLISFVFNMPTVPVAAYLQISFRNLGFARITANLLAVPTAVLSIITILLITVLSESVRNRALVCMSQQIWLLPPFIALVVMKSISGWQYFSISTVLLGFPWVHAIQVSWCSRNAGSIRTRTVSAALYNMAIQASSIVGSNIYQSKDGPRYFRANKILIGLIGFNILILYPGTYLFYKLTNKRRDKIWDGMSPQEKTEYLRSTKDEGNKRLDFRFDY